MPGAGRPCSLPALMARKKRNLGIIGVPIDLGAGRRGVDMGPSAIRIADLEKRLEDLGHKVVDRKSTRLNSSH